MIPLVAGGDRLGVIFLGTPMKHDELPLSYEHLTRRRAIGKLAAAGGAALVSTGPSAAASPLAPQGATNPLRITSVRAYPVNNGAKR